MLTRYSFLVLLAICLMLFPKLGRSQNKIVGTNTVLWKITSDRSAKISYLLGSIHLFNDAWLDSWPIIDSLVSVQDLYVSENNLAILASKNPPQITNSAKLKAKDYFGKDLDLVKNHFSNAYGSDIVKYIDTSRHSEELLQGLVQLLLNDYAFKMGLKISENPSTMDDIITVSALSKGKKYIGLDSVLMLRQLIASESWSKTFSKKIIDLVKQANGIDLPDTTKEEFNKFNKLITAYNIGLFNYSDREESDDGVKIVTRNTYWMTKLPKILEQNNSFIVVGALHLDGSKGLLNMLDGKGFKITPIKLR